jgi:two-component system chemotaxis response regulator CheY
MRALVVDDSRAIRRIVGDMLQQLGIEVTFAGNGLEALAELEKAEAFDVALVDWNMPEMDGLALVKAIRADARHAGLPVLMVTTETEMESMSLALGAGVNEYVMKPFDKDMIQGKLELLGIAV